MSFNQRGRMPLDYGTVTYPGSVLHFRGPSVDLSQPYVLCIGGSETFGKFIHAPYPTVLADLCGRPVANMGVMNAGLDVALNDPVIRRATETASAIILQVPGAQNMTNRFYSVHPRRNDRFVKATGILRTIYRDVDFTEFHFVRHLLTRLQELSPDRFAILREELQIAWRARMTRFVRDAAAPVHLLWLSHRRPEDGVPETGLGHDPLFVTPDMLQSVAAEAASLTVAVSQDPAPASVPRGMFFASGEEKAACMMPGPDVHARAAQSLAVLLKDAQPRPAA